MNREFDWTRIMTEKSTAQLCSFSARFVAHFQIKPEVRSNDGRTEKKCWCCGNVRPLISFLHTHRLARYMMGEFDLLESLSVMCWECKETHGGEEAYRIGRKNEIAYEESLAKLPKPRYSDYINSPRWKEKKESIKKALNPRTINVCACCGGTHLPIHFHHMTYERLGMEVKRDLAKLCAACHAAVHTNKSSIGHYPYQWVQRFIFQSFKSAGINRTSLLKLDPKQYSMAVVKLLRVGNHLFLRGLL